MVVTLQSFRDGDGDESDLDPTDFTDTPARFSDGGSSSPSSACSTPPFVSAPSSPSRGYFFSAPASPVHFVLYSAPSSSSSDVTRSTESEFPKGESEFEFDFSSRLSSSSRGGPLSDGSMISADELFSNGQIKPSKPQISSPLLDLEIEEEEDGDFNNRRGRDLNLRSRSVHRKARSLSPPLRNAAFNDDTTTETTKLVDETTPSNETTPSSSSRSSSSGSSRNSMKWIFLNNLLHRSKSEGRANGKEKFWSNISFSSSSSKTKSKEEKSPSPVKSQSPTNGILKRRGGGLKKPSAHELHYTKNRAQAEEMKKRTYLPYRHGLFGYNALNGLSRSLNTTVSSR